jgi:hypothetical protein
MNKFIVYKASGGLCHMLSGLIYEILLLILDINKYCVVVI